jgi:hypothetical protein
MRVFASRTAVAFGLLLVVLVVAGCGGSSSSNPKVSDSAAFVGLCEKKAQHPNTSNAQLAAFLKAHASAIVHPAEALERGTGGQGLRGPRVEGPPRDDPMRPAGPPWKRRLGNRTLYGCSPLSSRAAMPRRVSLP